ncbi:MAG TPA: hypothetical protein VM121_00860 [Acidimicrobiales bacterium]|nr:hypothetical protein [Acidimicrobiales bacterium]
MTASQVHLKTGPPARIAREAELLACTKHPGVVELIGVEGDLDPTLVTRRIDGQALAEVMTLSRAEVAGIVAAVASTLADLHQRDIVHGAIAAEHVVLGPGGRPVLCSFGYGGRVGRSSPDAPPIADEFVDPNHHDGDPLDPSVDVFGIGSLLRSLLNPVSRSRSDPLLRLADEATAADVERRPTAAQLATAINDAVPDAVLPGTSRATRLGNGPPLPRPGALEELRRAHAPSPRPRSFRLRPLKLGPTVTLGFISVVGALVVGLAISAANGRSGPSPVAAPAVEASLPFAGVTTLAGAPETTTTVLPSSTLFPSTVFPPTTVVPSTAAVAATGLDSFRCPAVTASLVADIDDDGCAEKLQYADGVLTAGTVRWSVGEAGDQVATGDWSCGGQSQLALLRPRTGDVFLFDGWASQQDLVAVAVTRVEGGFTLRPGDAGDRGCQRLVVDRRDGPPVVVPIGLGE